MKCMEARRLITSFIRKELGEKEQEEFLKHVEHCADCRDELDIYFTVHRALDSLDSGSHSYDFQNMLEEEIRAAKRGILKRKAMRIGRILQSWNFCFSSAFSRHMNCEAEQKVRFTAPSMPERKADRQRKK